MFSRHCNSGIHVHQVQYILPHPPCNSNYLLQGAIRKACTVQLCICAVLGMGTECLDGNKPNMGLSQTPLNSWSLCYDPPRRANSMKLARTKPEPVWCNRTTSCESFPHSSQRKPHLFHRTNMGTFNVARDRSPSMGSSVSLAVRKTQSVVTDHR